MTAIGRRRFSGTNSWRRFGNWLCSVTIYAAATSFGHTTPDANTLTAFAVHIEHTPLQSWGPGAGIYLGQGVFITAAHVAGHTWWTKPKVVVNGVAFKTQTIKEGSFDGVDLALLGVQQDLLPMRLRLRHITLCGKPPFPGQNVVTVVPDSVVTSRILAPERLPPDVRKFNTVIADVANTGNSGSGVFDVQLGCLLGIVSRKISISRKQPAGTPRTVEDIAKYFVPAATISAFMPANIRF